MRTDAKKKISALAAGWKTRQIFKKKFMTASTKQIHDLKFIIHQWESEEGVEFTLI
jgi:hypothetical protein